MNKLEMKFFDDRCVLIVDDSPMYRTAASSMLAKLGLTVQQTKMAQNAAEAVLLCKTEKFQLVLIDYNLGENADGFQFLDFVQTENLLCPDCVVVVVTGDSSASVVRGFSELSPDGYLIKPLNFNTLKERLTKFFTKKRRLAPALIAFDDANYELAFEECEKLILRGGDCGIEGMLLQARILMQQGKLEAGRNLFVSLNKEQSGPVASTELAKIAITQRQYSLAEFILDASLDKQPNSAKLLTQLALLHLAKGNVENAIEVIGKAIELSPKIVERHWVNVYCQLFSCSTKGALDAIQLLIRYSAHSLKDTIETYQLAASLVVDLALQQDAALRDKKLAMLKRYLQSWRNQFSHDKYKPFELLVMARAYACQGNRVKASAFIKEYKTLESTPSLLEQIELVKLSLVAPAVGDSLDLLAALDKTLVGEGQADEGIYHKALKRYIARWQNEMEEKKHNSVIHYEKALMSAKDNKFDTASLHMLTVFSQALILKSDVPKLLLHYLSRGWPYGFGRDDVLKIALKCKLSLIEDPDFPSKKDSEILDMLAAQLSYSDLSR